MSGKVCAQGEQQNGTKKVSPFGGLRIVSILLYLFLQYMERSWLLKQPTMGWTGENVGYWILGSLSFCCINIYMLTTAYELVDEKIRISAVAKLWGEVFFYSLLFAVITVAAGQATVDEVFGISNILFYVFPVSSGHFWLATAYLLLLLFSPLLNKALQWMSQRHLGELTLVLLVPFSLLPSVCPTPPATDDLGMGVMWFIVLYLIAAYIKKFGMPKFEKLGLVFYFVFVAGIMLFEFFAGKIAFIFPRLDHYMAIPKQYNFIFSLFAAVAIVCFAKGHGGKSNAFSKALNRIAGYTFGIYLITDHIFVRYKWMDFLQLGEGKDPVWAHMILSVLAAFAVALCIDVVRTFLFKGISIVIRCIWKKKEKKAEE